jgi:hypothetical protein
MDMEFLATNNEDRTMVFQHMHLVLLPLLLNHFYLQQLLKSMDYHLDIDFDHSRPNNKTQKSFKNWEKEMFI